MNAIQRRPLVDQAADVLLARIRAGEWGLGHRLPSETALAAELGIGRSTVREAIRGLAGRGVLESRQGAGVFVIATDPSDEWDAVLRRADIVTVIEARIAIEAEAAAYAAARRTPDDLAAIRRALDRRAESAALQPAQQIDADMAFHRAVVAAAHNEVVTELFDAFVPRMHRAMVELLLMRRYDTDTADQAAHEAIYRAILDGDEAAASGASRTHLQGLKELHQ